LGRTEIIRVFSARLYGSRSHKTKRLLNELTEGKETEESSDPTEVGRRVRTPDGIVRKAMSPEDVPDEDVRNLLSAMQILQMPAMTVYARLTEEREHAVSSWIRKSEKSYPIEIACCFLMRPGRRTWD
jgi:hypothetical protein